MTSQKRLNSYAARQDLMTNRRYRYRGCAPDVDHPAMAAGNLELPVTAWEAPDVDGGEDHAARRAREAAAVEVCVDCPVMVQCLAFGASVNASGKLAVPHGILGGMTALERHKALVEERQAAPVVAEPAPDQELRTPQKLAVFRAWAAYEMPEDVARAAGMDLRTANWQRSILKTKLGLKKDATRLEVLRAAVERGLLSAGEVVAVPGRPVQLSFDDALETVASAVVADLFPAASVLGAAA
ncbi:WhiB family transcriptional regulator [Streptomyces chartreusis]|uniref:WhiB family transcriptional regulator n=1 Tax=Streptomyces chartreusis TaxID=1969 RepID=UPI003652AC26